MIATASADEIQKVQEVFWVPGLEFISLKSSDSSIMFVGGKALFYWDDAGSKFPNMLQ
jgi:hypothetical protein